MAKITRIAPELPAFNLPAALEYYEHKLGFRVAMQMFSGNRRQRHL
jgi:hypothetical protein